MFSEKLIALLIGFLFLLVLSCDGPSGRQETQSIALTSKRTLQHDPAFWDYAASSHMLQTEIGSLAIEYGEPQSIKAMAEKAVGFHSNALQQLKAISRKYKTIQIPDSLTGADRDLVKEFEQLEGEEFSTRYKAFVSSSHQAQRMRYEEALRKADNEETKVWLSAMLMHLREELEQLQLSDSAR